MGIFVVTGASSGIGRSAAKFLREKGHTVYNVDIKGGDINTDLSTAEGRKFAIDRVHELCPDGINGLISNAGIIGAKVPSKVLRVNYFGSKAMVEGLYDLVKMRRGSIAVTASASVGYYEKGPYHVDDLLINCGDEERICEFIDRQDPAVFGNALYVSGKMALARFVRRVAPQFAAEGVVINAVLPGGVNTGIMDMTSNRPMFEKYTLGVAMPPHYRTEDFMAEDDLGYVMASLVLPEFRGIIGTMVYCDAGTHALLKSEVYGI